MSRWMKRVKSVAGWMGRPGRARAAVLAAATMLGSGPLAAQQHLNDLEMAHVAVTASAIDIRYAHLALAMSENQAVREFAQTMIRDHEAVNAGVAALAAKLGVTAQDNAMSRSLLAGAATKLDELTRLRGGAFDRAYMANELAYHETVNGAVEKQFIPAIQNPEVKKAFEGALQIFRGHERHAATLVRSLGGK